MHHDQQEIIAIVFIDIALIVAVARLLARVMRRLRQPSVIAEIVAALILGPSLLGALPGDLTDTLFPPDVRPYLAVLAALGLTIYMFVVGLELDLGLVRGAGPTAATISVCSVSLPFLLGLGLAVWLHDRHGTVAGEPVDFWPFALFVGVAMSVTAFPVLARILSERGIQRTPVGALALACAAVDDVLAWILLATVLAIVASSGALDLVVMVAESVLFVVVMFTLVRPRLRGLVVRRERAGRLTPDIFAVVLVGVLVCSYVTDKIGIHAIFGAFLFGAVMPRTGGEALSREILERVEQVTVLLLLPVFFVVTGLNVDVTGLGRDGLLELLGVVAVACVGKFVGAAAAARFRGIRPRRAASIGILMNTRGLTELVVLNIGLTVGVLDRELFTVMVLMAIVTTVMTEPLLRVVYPARAVSRDIVEAERAALGLSAEHRVLLLDQGGTAPADLVDVAVALLGTTEDSELVVARLEERSRSGVEVGAGLVSDTAALAASFEDLQVLAARARDLGARVHVHSTLTEDPAAEAVLRVQASRADVVVLPAGSELAAPLAALGSSVVVEVVLDGERPAIATAHRVVLAVTATEDGAAAVEQAMRVAESCAVPLAVVPGDGRRDARRVSTLRRKLGAAGTEVVDAEVVDASRPAILVVPATAGAAAAASRDLVLIVHGAGDDLERLDASLARRAEDRARAATERGSRS